ncbi:MAC/perforin domain-containing protein [Gimesia alba]|uniref:MAC/perforin domain-containing protein n=1 Tax=Gimesia alba TaxID=2527973 RepID=UPI0018D9B4EF|nr:MAC/perforin domain-containing protein [Gimesia alba]
MTPLHFAGKDSFVFESVPLDTVGTIEFILKFRSSPTPNSNQNELDKESHPASSQTKTGGETDIYDRFYLLTNASTEETRFALFVGKDFKTIGIANDAQEASLPVAKLNDGRQHHLVFVSHNELTEVFLDSVYQGYLLLGYGPQLNMPYRLGSWDGETGNFIGDMIALRIWDRALTKSEFSSLDSTYSLPASNHSAFSSLVSCSDFMNQQFNILNLRPTLKLSQMHGIPEGDPFSWIIPHQYEITKIRPVPINAKTSQGSYPAFSEIQIEFRGPERVLMTLSEYTKLQAFDNQTTYLSALRRAILHDLNRAQDNLDKSIKNEDLWKQYLTHREQQPAQKAKYTLKILGKEHHLNLSETEGDSVQPERIPAQLPQQPVGRTLKQLIVNNPIVERKRIQPEGMIPEPQDKKENKKYFEQTTYLPRKRVVGLAGTYRNEISSMRVLSNQELSKTYHAPTDGTHPSFDVQPFVARIPENSKFVGFVGFKTGQIRSIALAYIDPPEPDSSIPKWNENIDLYPQSIDHGRFVLRAMKEPVRDDEGVLLLANQGDQRAKNLIDPRDGRLHVHSNYTTYPVCQIRETIDGSLIVSFDEPDKRVKVRSMLLTKTSKNGMLYTGMHPQGTNNEYAVAMLDNGGLTFSKRSTDQSPWVFLASYEPVKQYDDSGTPENKLPWGDTFSSDQRPVLGEFNAMGYHIGKMDPRNYQISTGTTRRLFQWPTDESTEYQTTSAGKMIPHGYYFRNDREGIEKGRSSEITTRRTHQEAWNINLGLDIGVPEMASSSMKGSYHHELQTVFSSEVGYSVSIATETKYAIVLDRSRVQLDPQFRSDVNRLANLMIAGYDIPNSEFDRFINLYGTHYPYAVSYGGMAYQEMDYTKKEKEEIINQGFDISQTASVTIEDVTAGRTIGGGYTWGNGTGSIRQKKREFVKTIGGEIAKGGGWSLPDHDEVPVLLDLQPIEELFSPIFFEKKVVWTKLREKIADRAKFPNQYEARIVKVENLANKPFELHFPVFSNPYYSKEGANGPPSMSILLGDLKETPQVSYALGNKEVLIPAYKENLRDASRMIFTVPQHETSPPQFGKIVINLTDFLGKDKVGTFKINSTTSGEIVKEGEIAELNQVLVNWNTNTPTKGEILIGKPTDLENSLLLRIHFVVQRSSLFY